MNVDSILQEIGAMKTKMNKKEKIVKTPEEAIETIKSNMHTSGYQMLRESLIMAIGALEKQKPKKPVLRNDNGKLRKSCPVCGCFFSPLSRNCPKCGQAILQENKDD